MAIVAKLLKAIPKGSEWKIEIEYTDGLEVSVVTTRFNGKTPKDLKNFVIAQINKKENAKVTDFSQFIGQEIDITPEPVVTPPDPTLGEIAKTAWFEDWRKLKQMTQLVDNGLFDADDPDRVTLQNSLKAAWKNSYLGSI